MNKQFDLFQKMKIKEVCENISRMTYAYINPDTKQPTVVPSKHYKDILDQPVEVMVNDQVKKQFLNIMFKQMKALKDEEPILFNETLLLMDLNKTPDSLELNEEAALKITATELVENEKTQRMTLNLWLNSLVSNKMSVFILSNWIKYQSQKEVKTMTYNTKIYNYKNLHTDDKQIVQAQLLMFETIEDLITEYTYSKEACTNTLETISYEEGIKALEDAKEKMYSDIVEYMVFAIEGYEEDVNEVDTNDPFYGLEIELEEM